MNKKYMTWILGAAAVLCVGIGIGSAVQCCGNKTAVVDVAAVVGKSPEIQALKKEAAIKKQELTQWLQNAQNDVKSEKDKEKKEALLQQYNAEFAQKRKAISIDYNAKLKIVDKNIIDTIIKTAKNKGYKTVIAKGAVLYGGADITDIAMSPIWPENSSLQSNCMATRVSP